MVSEERPFPHERVAEERPSPNERVAITQRPCLRAADPWPEPVTSWGLMVKAGYAGLAGPCHARQFDSNSQSHSSSVGIQLTTHPPSVGIQHLVHDPVPYFRRRGTAATTAVAAGDARGDDGG